MDAPALPSTRSYLDFDGLGELKGQARKGVKSATRETAQQFEALFLQMTMKSMRDSVMKNEENDSSGVATYEGMFDREVSLQLAKRNTLGLADMLVKNLDGQQVNAQNTTDMLKARQAGIAAAPVPLNPKQVGVSLTPAAPTVLPLPRVGGIPLVMPGKMISGSGT
jgi:Rod binding domain-containing protein